MKKTLRWMAYAALTFSLPAFAGGDKHGEHDKQAKGAPAHEELGTGGSGQVEADPAVMKKMKEKTQSAMKEHKAWIDENMKGWPDKAKEVAAVTIESYGAPEGVTSSMLVWGAKGPWKRTVLYRELVQHDFPMPHKDLLEQFVDFKAPTDKFDDLAEFDGSVIAERTKGQLSARCDKEEANFLAINLATEVAQGKKSAQEARDYYARAIKGMLKGEKDPYLAGLKIEQQQTKTADADQARFGNPMLQQKQGRKPTGR